MLFHGSKVKFDEFVLDFVGQNGTSEGMGIYLTNNIDIAKGYAENGYLYKVDLSYEGRVITDDDFTFTEEEVSYLVDLMEEKGVSYLENYGEVEYESYGVVKERAMDSLMNYNESDVDLICELINATGDIHSVNDIIYSEFDITHIEAKDSWGNQDITIVVAPELIDILEVEPIGAKRSDAI